MMRQLILAILLVVSAGHAAQAEGGRLREFLAKRMQERAATGEAGGFLEEFGSGSCADHKEKVSKLLSGNRGGRNSKGPPGDLHDVAYGDQALQKLDVYLPKRKTAESAPVIIMVHGGGWCVGDKSMRGMTGNKLEHYTGLGFIYVSANYPMVAEGSLAIQQAEHVARAVAFVQAHAAEWGGDPSRVILMRHSAGAHLVSLVNADAKLRAAAGVKPVLGTISLDSGTTNVVTQMKHPIEFMKDRYAEAFGDEEEGWIAASPFHHLDKTAAPWLSVCSAQRAGNPCGQSKEYAEKSNGLGIRAEVIPIDKKHGEINNDLGLPGDYTDAVDKFIASLDPVAARYINQE
ncbi:MAG TPA: alpha/beta hydrolase [Patescibacteria group bacterium]|nr:alpha/beta hydrolase [Patescibacteria group bacterium]